MNYIKVIFILIIFCLFSCKTEEKQTEYKKLSNHLFFSPDYMIKTVKPDKISRQPNLAYMLRKHSYKGN